MIKLWIVLLCASCLVLADEKSVPPKPPKPPKPTLDPQVQAIVGLATSAPAEFTADALLRIVDSGRVPERELKIELIEQAFKAASSAQQPVRRVAVPAVGPDTAPRYLSSALQLKLDALSLQSRAVKAMLDVDATKGRELFQRISRPNLSARKCEDALVYDVSAYYDAVGYVIRSAFSSAEKKKDQHIAFLVAQLSGINSISELAPAARLIVSLGLDAKQLEIAGGVFSQKMESLSGDDRSFSVNVLALQLELSALSAAMKGLQIETQSLIRSSRKLLVTEFTGPRCSDSVGPKASDNPDAVNALQWFNGDFRGEVPAITAEEATSSKVDGALEIDKYFQSEEALHVMQAVIGLRMTAEGRIRPEADRQTLEWKSLLGDVLNQLANWNVRQEKSEADYFHQKAIVYEALLELTGPGDEREKILRQAVTFIANSSLQHASPVEWFWHPKSMLERLRSVNQGEPGKLLAAFKSSANSALVLYATLEEVMPEAPFFAR